MRLEREFTINLKIMLQFKGKLLYCTTKFITH